MTNPPGPFRIGSDPAPPPQSPATETFWLSALQPVRRIKFSATFSIANVSIRTIGTATRSIPT